MSTAPKIGEQQSTQKPNEFPPETTTCSEQAARSLLLSPYFSNQAELRIDDHGNQTYPSRQELDYPECLRALIAHRPTKEVLPLSLWENSLTYLVRHANTAEDS